MEHNKETGENKGRPGYNRQGLLMAYDALILLFVETLLLFIFPSSTDRLGWPAMLAHVFLWAVCLYASRILCGVYRQVWRYGGSVGYIRLMFADAVSGIAYYCLQKALPMPKLIFVRIVSLVCFNLLCCLGIRLLYWYLYEYAGRQKNYWPGIWRLLEIFSAQAITAGNKPAGQDDKIKIAIVGAGRVGAMLAEEFFAAEKAKYRPCCFIDIDKTKIGREIAGIPVISNVDASYEKLADLGVKEIVFALPQVSPERKMALYEFYKPTGCKMHVYDYPIMESAAPGKRQMREFVAEELLFRRQIRLNDDKTGSYYKDKVILITGGGGSIGSELCRQIARMNPKKLVILDIYENGAYDVQQELRIAYGSDPQLQVEIVSVCDRAGLEKVFAQHCPDVVLHAAAHKHVPLMEHNCCEAVKNNVFGTLNVVETAEKYGVGKFVMISTDKAVNPTNVMGATKRMCEMIVLGHSRMGTSTAFSVVRFGNVLGSAGSVIPLFRKQIMKGGPVTVTDKRIIRYFMTIPEASQLVLESGAMAKNGELFVLDMGKPVRILDLAENMIRLSGYEPYRDIDIVETGLRPGEKLYEELLIHSESLDKTENSLIFIERGDPPMADELCRKLEVLSLAVEQGNDSRAREALMEVVPTFRCSEEVNVDAIHSREMQMAAAEKTN